MNGAVQLNRFGLERGATWKAVVAAFAVFAPVLLWTFWDSREPDSQAAEPDSVIELRATAPSVLEAGEAEALLRIPAEGWSISTGTATPQSAVLYKSGVRLTATAYAAVRDLDQLYRREARKLSHSDSPLYSTDRRDYETATGLTGWWAALTGDNVSGSLVVLGRGSAAAVLVVQAPVGRLGQVVEEVQQIADALEVSA